MVADGRFAVLDYRERPADVSSDDPLARCAKCGTVVKESDAILDVIRIGFVALKKVNKVQISGG